MCIRDRLKTKEAANVYLYISVLSGLVLLFGILMLYSMLGTVEINEIYAAASAYENKNKIYAACALMAFGFATKAGTFPMHVWLPKAHPVAPAPASALPVSYTHLRRLIMLRAVIATVFILGGMFVFATGVKGIYKMNYVINRLHVTAFCDTLAMLLIIIGLIIISGFSFSTLKLIVILFFMWITNPVISVMITKAEILSGDNPKEYEVIDCQRSSK